MHLTLPGGVVVQARGCSSVLATDTDRRPDWGLYLDDCWRGRAKWPHELVRWPDFDIPGADDEPTVFNLLQEAWRRALAGELVEVGCLGGTGRTGTALACLVVLSGKAPNLAIEWVRANYNSAAIETAPQENLVSRFADSIGRGACDDAAGKSTSDEVALESLRVQLLADIDRWTSELAKWRDQRGTLWFGILDKACKRFEAILFKLTARAVDEADEDGASAVAAVGQGKQLDRFTLGQCLDVLRGLDRRRPTLLSEARIGKGEWTRVERVIAMRNDFEHGRVEFGNNAIGQALDFLGNIRIVCESDLVARRGGEEGDGHGVV